MDLEDLESKLHHILGDDFTISLDEDQQVVIHTGLFENDDGDLEAESIGIDDDDCECDDDYDDDKLSNDMEDESWD
jgi:hypothetical protein